MSTWNQNIIYQNKVLYTSVDTLIIYNSIIPNYLNSDEDDSNLDGTSSGNLVVVTIYQIANQRIYPQNE